MEGEENVDDVDDPEARTLEISQEPNPENKYKRENLSLFPFFHLCMYGFCLVTAAVGGLGACTYRMKMVMTKEALAW